MPFCNASAAFTLHRENEEKCVVCVFSQILLTKNQIIVW